MPAISFPRFRADLLALYAPPLARPATRTKMAQVLAELQALGVRSTRDLTPALIARFISSRPERSPATVRGLLSYARAACSYAARMKQVAVNPFEAHRFRVEDPVEEEAPKHHAAAAIAAVLARADTEAADGGWPAHRIRALAYLIAFTGVRKTEALGLQWAEVDHLGRVVWLRSNKWRRLKTKASGQPVPIAPALGDVLADWHPRAGSELVIPNLGREQPWFHGGPGVKPLDQLAALGRRAGVPGLTFQSLRHSWATHAESLWGLSGPTIKRILRHTTERTSLHYYRHADLDNLRTAAAAIHFPGSQAS